MVEQVRRFNRTVAQRVGALNDRFLARERPMAEARLLWEIGPGGAEVRALRSRLGLDSLLTLAIRRRLDQRFRTSLPATLIWNQPTVEGISEFLVERLTATTSQEAH